MSLLTVPAAPRPRPATDRIPPADRPGPPEQPDAGLLSGQPGAGLLSGQPGGCEVPRDRAAAGTRHLPRRNFAFAAGGRAAAALRANPDGGLEVEAWRDGPSGWTCTATGILADPGDQVLPLPDGRLLLLWAGGGGAEVVLLHPADRRRPPAQLCRRAERSVRLAPPPPGDRTALACLLGYDGIRTRFWRLLPGGGLDPLTGSLRGAAQDATWLAGPRLVVTQRDPSGASRVVALDPGGGVASTLLDVGPQTRDRVALSAPGSDLMVVTTDAGGGEWTGFGRPGRGEDFWFPEELRGDDRLDPLAMDPTGRYVLLHRRFGMPAELVVYDVPAQRSWSLAAPAGRPGGPAAWTGDGIVLPWSSRAVPHTTLLLDPAPGAAPPVGARGLVGLGGW